MKPGLPATGYSTPLVDKFVLMMAEIKTSEKSHRALRAPTSLDADAVQQQGFPSLPCSPMLYSTFNAPTYINLRNLAAHLTIQIKQSEVTSIMNRTSGCAMFNEIPDSCPDLRKLAITAYEITIKLDDMNHLLPDDSQMPTGKEFDGLTFRKHELPSASPAITGMGMQRGELAKCFMQYDKNRKSLGFGEPNRDGQSCLSKCKTVTKSDQSSDAADESGEVYARFESFKMLDFESQELPTESEESRSLRTEGIEAIRQSCAEADKGDWLESALSAVFPNDAKQPGEVYIISEHRTCSAQFVQLADSVYCDLVIGNEGSASSNDFAVVCGDHYEDDATPNHMYAWKGSDRMLKFIKDAQAVMYQSPCSQAFEARQGTQDSGGIVSGEEAELHVFQGGEIPRCGEIAAQNAVVTAIADNALAVNSCSPVAAATDLWYMGSCQASVVTQLESVTDISSASFQEPEAIPDIPMAGVHSSLPEGQSAEQEPTANMCAEPNPLVQPLVVLKPRGDAPQPGLGVVAVVKQKFASMQHYVDPANPAVQWFGDSSVSSGSLIQASGNSSISSEGDEEGLQAQGRPKSFEWLLSGELNLPEYTAAEAASPCSLGAATGVAAVCASAAVEQVHSASSSGHCEEEVNRPKSFEWLVSEALVLPDYECIDAEAGSVKSISCHGNDVSYVDDTARCGGVDAADNCAGTNVAGGGDAGINIAAGGNVCINIAAGGKAGGVDGNYCHSNDQLHPGTGRIDGCSNVMCGTSNCNSAMPKAQYPSSKASSHSDLLFHLELNDADPQKQSSSQAPIDEVPLDDCLSESGSDIQAILEDLHVSRRRKHSLDSMREAVACAQLAQQDLDKNLALLNFADADECFRAAEQCRYVSYLCSQAATRGYELCHLEDRIAAYKDTQYTYEFSHQFELNWFEAKQFAHLALKFVDKAQELLEASHAAAAAAAARVAAEKAVADHWAAVASIADHSIASAGIASAGIAAADCMADGAFHGVDLCVKAATTKATLADKLAAAAAAEDADGVPVPGTLEEILMSAGVVPDDWAMAEHVVDVLEAAGVDTSQFAYAGNVADVLMAAGVTAADLAGAHNFADILTAAGLAAGEVAIAKNLPDAALMAADTALMAADITCMDNVEGTVTVQLPPCWFTRVGLASWQLPAHLFIPNEDGSGSYDLLSSPRVSVTANLPSPAISLKSPRHSGLVRAEPSSSMYVCVDGVTDGLSCTPFECACVNGTTHGSDSSPHGYGRKSHESYDQGAGLPRDMYQPSSVMRRVNFQQSRLQQGMHANGAGSDGAVYAELTAERLAAHCSEAIKHTSSKPAGFWQAGMDAHGHQSWSISSVESVCSEASDASNNWEGPQRTEGAAARCLFGVEHQQGIKPVQLCVGPGRKMLTQHQNSQGRSERGRVAAVQGRQSQQTVQGVSGASAANRPGPSVGNHPGVHMKLGRFVAGLLPRLQQAAPRRR